jgi:outer membrane protein OmpA-like peptidoglycan-associated protein/tetratricopeptide (TPR) repeat protein
MYSTKTISIELVMKRTVSLIIIFLVNCSLSIAQSSFTSSKKAFKYYEEAARFLNRKEFNEAEQSLKKAISKDGKFLEAYLMLGDIYFYEDKAEKSIESYKKALEIDPMKYPNIYFALGNVEFSIAKYKEAKADYASFININNEREAQNTDNIAKARKNIINCDFAIEAIKNPVEFNPVNLGPEVNSKDHEYFPSVTVDGSTLLYTRLVKNTNSMGGEGTDEDFYISKKYDNRWTKSDPLGRPINTNFNEGAPCLSPDGQILIFTACEVFGNYGGGRNGYGSCDLFFSRIFGRKWTDPINMGPPVNTKSWETQPSYSSDGRTLYFIRGTAGKSGRKSQYIYMSELDGEGKWKEPLKLNEKINVPGSIQESVFIHPDNQTLYFSSDGPPGMGGQDIFMSKRDKNGEWGEPENLGYPINTEKDENSFMVSGDGRTAYFASDRKGGYGGLDLYSFDLPEKDRPQPVSYLKGKIFDKDTKEPVYARFELTDVETGRTSVKSFSNKGNGEFLVCLPTNKNYALNVSSDKYLFYSENFNFSLEFGVRSSGYKTFSKDIALQPIKVGETVVLRNIFFETAKYELKPESQVELNKLIDLLSKNPNMKIEISGHTDNVGGKDYNQSLSENRAKAVYDYLVANNIKTDRLSFKGYGEIKPIDNNSTDEGKANNRRTEFKVVGN